MSKCLTKNRASTLLRLLFGAWWVVNIMQAAFTELANDEAYYHLFAQKLSWGYFDHPPMTALLVWLGSFLGGELGVRFFFTILQPAYLLILWHIIKPREFTVRDVTLFFVICAALPVMQLYGFIAVPDGPLMLFSAVFLLCYKRFTEHDNWLNTMLLGGSMALLAYSKYHGALVVVFTLMSNPRMLRNYKFYLSGLLALLLLLPHLMWQQGHDWASFRYHLTDRNKTFRWSYITEFLLNLAAIFNPLFLPLYIKAWIKIRAKNPVERAMYCNIAGFVIFFTLSSIRGYVQPQWVIPITFGLISILFNYARVHTRTGRYVMVSGIVTVSLVALVRIVMIFNPTGIKYEIFDNKPSYGAIAEIADGRTVIFGGSYSVASKYIFYTGQPAYSQPSASYRTSQWQYYDQDSEAVGHSVVVETWSDESADSSLVLANGRTFHYRVIDDFRPVRKVGIEMDGIPASADAGQPMSLRMTLHNPYDYDIELGRELPAVMIWKDRQKQTVEVVLDQVGGVLPAHGTLSVEADTRVPELEPGRYEAGIALRPRYTGYWFNSGISKTELRRCSNNL